VLFGALSIPLLAQAAGTRSVDDVMAGLAPKLRTRLMQRFKAHGVSYPPAELTLIAYKQEMRLEVWAPKGKRWVRVASYPILAASGERGPKLREGDEQVPEGVYRLTQLNPNSKFHLSIRVDYPSQRDKSWADRDQRSNLGGDIFIHGDAVSRGCLAIGDRRIEELFALVADTGLTKSRIIIAPDRHMRERPKQPEWVDELYQDVRRALDDVQGND
jgi:murein L,D-transpeptidase YafK